MIKKYSSAPIIFCCLVFACTATHSQKVTTEADGVLITPQQFEKIVDIEWQLNRMTLDGQPKPLVKNSKLAEDGTIVWNRAFGMTRMAGPPELMEQESVFMAALTKTARMVLNDSALTLTSRDRSTVLVFDQVQK